MKVQDVCAVGETEACQKVRFTETGSFAGGVAGGALTGALFTSLLVGTLCVALGVPTGDAATLACGVVLVGGASLAGEVLYEMTK
ncbi:hypothetical protein [Pseudomonas synxantha]|jgi:hypothetical protein|uniref:hypothetical protein n=1 Tax=Pseudomonas synxantha TaxID=47883 RepID=UPI003569A5DB